MKLDGSHIVISGGASGLGLGTAETLVARGAKVTLLDRNPSVIEDNEWFKANKSKVKALELDITTDCNTMMKILEKIEKPIHGLINCAGIGSAERTVSKTGDPCNIPTFEYVIKVNLIGNYSLASKIASIMTKNQVSDTVEERGVIINTASIAAYEGQQGQCGYSGSKGGIVGLSVPMARDLAPWKIRVNSVAPGIFETPMSAMVQGKARKVLLGAQAFPDRFGDVKEFGHLCCFLIENSMMNGETVRIDGGCRMPKL